MMYSQWIVIAQVICLAAAISLLAVAYDLDKETPGFVRALVVISSVLFFGVFLISFNNPKLYHYATDFAYAGMGALILVYVGYLILKRRIQPVVVRVSGFALVISILLWVVGNLSDKKRQEIQIENTNAPTSNTVPVGTSTQQHIDSFNKIRR